MATKWDLICNPWRERGEIRSITTRTEVSILKCVRIEGLTKFRATTW